MNDYYYVIIALKKQHDEIVSLFFELTEKNRNQTLTFVDWAVSMGSIKILKLAKKRGWNLNELHQGSRPIHKAAQKTKEEMIIFLIESGVSVDERDNCGSTPLHYACGYGYINIIKLLLRYGADTTAFNSYNYTALLACIEREFNN